MPHEESTQQNFHALTVEEALKHLEVYEEGLSSAEREELVRLRRQLRQVQLERDILAKATAWFASKSERTSTPSLSS